LGVLVFWALSSYSFNKLIINKLIKR
jgi:hypothetical protein